MKYLTVEEVCGKLARGGCDEVEVGKVFAARLEPENLDSDDKDKKFPLVAQAAEGVFIVVCQFGLGKPRVKASPLDEGGPDWRPRFISVNGPYSKPPLDESKTPIIDSPELIALQAKAKELCK
jgi:hypothetical protein